MNWKITVAIVVVATGCLLGVVLRGRTQNSGAAVSVTLRIAVTPADQTNYVIQRASSAQFKYLVGKMSGVKPVLAQRLSLKPVSNTALIEAKVGVPTKDQAQRYVEVFLPTLQGQCGSQARLSLAEQTIR